MTEAEMQACLEAGDFGGRPSEVRAIEAAFGVGVASGAAVAFGIIGMAEAIRRNAPRLVERHYWTTEDGKSLYYCFCPGCGCQLKHRESGVDEGTDNEWCGACRY